MAKKIYNYEWTLANAEFTKNKGKVFSCFACGGGSTMGYKLSGFDVLGCNEIDPKMIETYKLNHNPKYAYLEPIQTFKQRNDLPDELYHLDILDGSPPCSSFSMAGNREDDWGKEKQFREGQAEQVLDTLFFDFIDLAKKLQPKVVVAENVKGLMMGEAKQYVIQIYREFENAGYNVQHWLLDASKMGVPQRRERVFFVALRNDLCSKYNYQKDLFTTAPLLELEFKEPEIAYKKIADDKGKKLTDHQLMLWNLKIDSDTNLGDVNQRERNLLSDFNAVFVKPEKVLNTITANGKFIDFEIPQHISDAAIIKAQTFPLDYNFKENKPVYMCGMSVPPIMTARIADEIFEQWLKPLHSFEKTDAGGANFLKSFETEPSI